MEWNTFFLLSEYSLNHIKVWLILYKTPCIFYLDARRDKTKLADLDFLKKQNQPGPFTKKSDVELFIKNNLSDEIKNKRLYIEVRYAKNTSLSLRPNSPLFRLRKNSKNLLTAEYAEHLIQYFDETRNITSITMNDLNSALTGIQLQTTSSHTGMRQNIQVGSPEI